MTDKPVTFSGLILTLALAVLAVVAYYWQLSPGEVTLWSGVLAAICALLHFGLEKWTTPKSKPVDQDGMPLVRALDQSPPIAAAQAGRTVVRGETPVTRPRGVAGTPDQGQASRGVQPSLEWSK